MEITHVQAPKISRRVSARTCRECGCTELNACYRPGAGACGWVDVDLCSHCKDLVQARAAAAAERRGKRIWRAVAMSGAALWGALIAATFVLEGLAARGAF